MKLFRPFLLILILFSLSSCALFKSNPQKKFEAAQKQEQKAEKAIEVKTEQIQEKSKSFVYGAKYSNEKDTNRTAYLDVSGRFLDLAQLTLGPANLQDSITIRKIADELIDSYKAETEDAKKAKIKAEKDLQAYVNQVVILQKEKDGLVKVYQDKIEKLEKINEQNASKASQWDEENGFWQQFNIFRDIGKLIKKLFVLVIIGGLGFIIFHILEVLFPGLRIVSSILAFAGKIAMKLAPSIKSSLNLVSDNVLKTLKVTVKGLQSSFDKLKNHPIEQDLVQNFPDNYMFNKKEVLGLLEQLSLNIEKLIKTELDAQNDNSTRAVINVAKSELKSMDIPDKSLI